MKQLYHVRSKIQVAYKPLHAVNLLQGTSCPLPSEEHCATACDEAVSRSLHQFAESLGNAIDAKDPRTSCHSEEVAVIAQAIGQTLGMTCHESDLLHIAGHLHDIGKIGVPDRVLQKEGPLNDDEMRLIKMHPAIGANIVQPVQAFSNMTGIQAMILHHHERYDGKGYPSGLAGNAIPRGARIIAAADSLSAMLQDRPYRASMTFDQTLEELQRCSGTQFDPLVVQAVIAARQHIHDLVLMLKDSDQAPPCLTALL
jgi:HD-GYP domain-containing protein (c-di-GMP phosphodiesterase class II)